MTTRSDKIVEGLCKARPGIKKRLFANEIRTRWPDSPELYEAAGKMIPDAFEFHDDLKHLTIIEVVDTHPIRQNKAENISILARWLDDEGWTAGLAVWNNCGDFLGEVPAWTCESYYLDPRLGAARDIFPEIREIAREAESNRDLTVEELHMAVSKISL